MGRPGTEPVRLVHVRKELPSYSGVARYAEQFAAVAKDVVDDYQPFGTGGDPVATRRLRTIVATARRLDRHCRRHGPTHVWVELSGGAAAELWAVAALLYRRRRPVVVATLHDPPAVTGGPFAFPRWDRRPLRRLAAITAPLGRRVERALLDRLDLAVCLSGAGRDALVAAVGPRQLPAVLPPFFGAPDPHPSAATPVVFLPGPLSSTEQDRLIGALDGCPGPMHLRIGLHAGGPLRPSRHRLDDLGELDQDGLTAAYRSADAVIRLWEPDDVRYGWGNTNAVSGTVIDAVAAGALVITNCARGGEEWVDEAGGVNLPRDADPAAHLPALLAPAAVRTRRARSQEWMQTQRSPAAQRDDIRRILDTATRHHRQRRA
jgi:hypothetical protein